MYNEMIIYIKILREQNEKMLFTVIKNIKVYYLSKGGVILLILLF